MNAAKLAMLLVFNLSALGSALAAEVEETPEEIIVTGREPGPPLWKVSKGENVLWIFPYLDWIPQDMTWDSERVARVISESQEFLDGPHLSGGWPKVILLNPIHIAGSMRMLEETRRNADGGTLEENVPPELYARFAALQARYFPGSEGALEMRPPFAGMELMGNLHWHEGLVAGDDILKNIRRLARNRNVKRTEISDRANFGDNFRDHVKRTKALYKSFTPELEQECFEQQLRHMEEDLDEMKTLANSWAQGSVDEFRYSERYRVHLTVAELSPFAGLSACIALWTGDSSPEQKNVADMMTRLNQRWLDAVGKALERNASTFAVLPINDLINDDGLLNRLRAKGYEVTEP